MAEPVKFDFGNRFDEPTGLVPSDTEIAVADLAQQHQAALALAVEQAHARGFTEGEAAAKELVSARLADHLATIEQATERVDLDMAGIAEDARRQAVGLAMAAVRKLVGELIERDPMARIEPLVSDCLAAMPALPRLNVHVAPALVDEARTRIEARALEQDFTGRVNFIADPDAALGDCRLEWPEGRVVLDNGLISERVDAAIERFMGRNEEVKPNMAEAAGVGERQCEGSNDGK